MSGTPKQRKTREGETTTYTRESYLTKRVKTRAKNKAAKKARRANR